MTNNSFSGFFERLQIRFDDFFTMVDFFFFLKFFLLLKLCIRVAVLLWPLNRDFAGLQKKFTKLEEKAFGFSRGWLLWAIARVEKFWQKKQQYLTSPANICGKYLRSS
jgi:hypothetical protein